MSSRTYSYDEKGFPEAKIKIAYLVNFLRFIEWPEGISHTSHICIVGSKSGYHDASENLANQTINDKKIVIKEYSEKSGLQDLGSCQIIFVTSAASHRQKIVANTVKGRNVLTVGETDGFIQHGGMINFIDRENTIRFEINLDAVNDTDLIITSKILRIAERVIHDAGVQ